MVSTAKPRRERAEGLSCSNHGHHDTQTLSFCVTGNDNSSVPWIRRPIMAISSAFLKRNSVLKTQFDGQAGAREVRELHEACTMWGSSDHLEMC